MSFRSFFQSTLKNFFVFLFLNLFFLPLSSSPQPQKTKPMGTEVPVIKVGVDVVNVFVTVRGKRGEMSGPLTKEDFTVLEDDRPQQVDFFERETNLPLTMAMLIDTSGSTEEILELEKSGAAEFLRSVLRENDLACVIDFAISVDLVADYTNELPKLEKAIRPLKTHGGVGLGPIPQKPAGTLLYDAIYLAAQEKLRSEAGRKVMVLITDGDDQGSKMSFQEAIEAVQKADTIVFPIFFQAPPRFFTRRGSRPLYTGNPSVLNRLAQETGGRAFYPNSEKDLVRAFEQIRDDLRSQYRLAYYSTNTARDGTFRKITVRTHKKDLKVTARKGYYAPRES